MVAKMVANWAASCAPSGECMCVLTRSSSNTQHTPRCHMTLCLNKAATAQAVIENVFPLRIA